jgi:hypothetical protein
VWSAAIVHGKSIGHKLHVFLLRPRCRCKIPTRWFCSVIRAARGRDAQFFRIE